MAHVIEEYELMTKRMYFIDTNGNKVFDTTKYMVVFGFYNDWNS